MTDRRLISILCFTILILLLLSACNSNRPVDNASDYAAFIQPSEPAVAAEDWSGMLQISEIMPKNRSFLLSDGEFRDWIELTNLSSNDLLLDGWTLSDGKNTAELGGVLIQGSSNYVLFSGTGENSFDFSLSSGETVSLSSPDGVVQASVSLPEKTGADVSYVPNEGELDECLWPTPGYENSLEGYSAFCDSLSCSSPLIISEVMVSNQSYAQAMSADIGFCDWAELKNVSDAALSLSAFSLSDGSVTATLPERVLAPGEAVLIYCTDDFSGELNGEFFTGFSFGPKRASLFLLDSEGAAADYVSLHDVPVNGSIGRLDGSNGFFYFSIPTPLAANAVGFRTVAPAPECETREGVYTESISLTVALSSEYTVYYTTDGSVPDQTSTVYSGPFVIDDTAIVRAVAAGDGMQTSRVATFSFIMGEDCTLPVLSLVTDDSALFAENYRNGRKEVKVPAHLSLYDGQDSFSVNCGVEMNGKTSLGLPKKSVKVSFSGKYGDGKLKKDVFNCGIDEYSALVIRGGQDYTSSIFRNELCQDLCLAVSDSVLSQHSKYCVLYIDGQYFGIYCLKEDISRQLYASVNGVSKQSVEVQHSPAEIGSDFYNDVIRFCELNDMTVPANYEQLRSVFDIDSLIDWIIVEGYSANTDIQGNIRYFRSPEKDDRWQIAFFDLDWSYLYPGSVVTNVVYPLTQQTQISGVVRALLYNADFRDALFTRFAELITGPLSNEAVIERIEDYVTLLDHDVPKDRERWGLSYDAWKNNVATLINWHSEYNWAGNNVANMISVYGMSRDEVGRYFSTLEVQ